MIGTLTSHLNHPLVSTKLNYVSVRARKGSAEYLCQDRPADWFKTFAGPKISLGASHAAIKVATQFALTPLNCTTAQLHNCTTGRFCLHPTKQRGNQNDPSGTKSENEIDLVKGIWSCIWIGHGNCHRSRSAI